MNLYLLRHGAAESNASSDASRQLTEAGREEVASVARQFVTKELNIDCCYVSPFQRAQQTADIFLSELADAPVPVTVALLSPNQRAAQAIKLLESLNDENILLVSHNPIMSELLSLLVDGNIDNLTILDTGNLACVSLDVVGLGMGTCSVILMPGADSLSTI